MKTKTISLIITMWVILTIGLTSATITQDIFSDQVTNLEIDISESQSNPVYFNLTQGESKNICLSETESIFVKLERIGSNYIDFYILENTDLSFCKIVAGEEDKEDVIEIGLTGYEPNGIDKESGSGVNLTYGNVLLIINKIFKEEFGDFAQDNLNEKEKKE